MTNPDSNAWRPIVALLASADARTVYAQIVLGVVPDAGAVSPSKRVRILGQLESAGLVRRDGDDVVAVDERLLALLKQDAGHRPRTGPEKFLRRDGTIDRYPTNHGERVALLRFIAGRAVAPAERLAEGELNERLAPFDPDTARLRRYLVDFGILERTASGSEYAWPDNARG
ncbi:DUF2087 domain-containing protein [Microbacterium sp. Root61]|uniref:DUF2087 domain-containing protein n=1 Tax=Microbacterium sp. Root61 TaxID=1736570 RepID=UPI0009EA8369|nr:DUF2087 domain-containing protein [Microbacterium sp. Root61]